MQDNVVKSFRQRPIRNGCTDVSIFDCFNGKYSVQFVWRGDSYQYVCTRDELTWICIPRCVPYPDWYFKVN